MPGKDQKIFLALCLLLAIMSYTYTGQCIAIEITSCNLKLRKNVKSIRQIRDENVIKQTADFSCGAAGLSTIFNYYLGDPVTEKQIMDGILQTTDIEKVRARKGFSLLDLKKYAQDRGYKVTGYKMDIDFLREFDQPVMVPVKFKNYRHFIIVKKVIGDRVFIADPAMGNMIMKASWFSSIWQDGVGLVIESKSQSASVEKLKGQEPATLTAIREKDMILVNSKSIKRFLGAENIRTTVFPSEFRK
jgi:predicted double-glycine peptidase